MLTKVLAFDLFAIHLRFLMNLSDEWSCDLVDQQVNVCLSVCMSFEVLTQLGGCTNSSRLERKERTPHSGQQAYYIAQT